MGNSEFSCDSASTGDKLHFEMLHCKYAGCAYHQINQIRASPKMQMTAVLSSAPEGGYIAFNPETGTTTQGESVEEALANLREATELFLEESPQVLTVKAFITTFDVTAHA